MEYLNITPLKKTELKSINGGDKFSEDLFRVAGFLWQTINNIGDAIVEHQVERSKNFERCGGSTR